MNNPSVPNIPKKKSTPRKRKPQRTMLAKRKYTRDKKTGKFA